MWTLGGLSEAVIGRAQSNPTSTASHTLHITFEDSWISHPHARIVQKRDSSWWLEDLASRNGTFCNGVAEHHVRLSDGDLIEIGHTFLLFRDRPLAADSSFDGLGGQDGFSSPEVQTFNLPLARAFARIRKLAPTNVSIVLHGESGTGKEVVARAIHAWSERPGPFVAVNCGGLPETLVQTELFGYRKGAFSGACEDRLGLIRSAHGGTLFLDEIGDLPLSCQVTLLRVLQEREVLPVGALRPIPVDVRVVAATHRDLDDLAHKGLFRADLLARLSGFVTQIPPLRERREDFGGIVAVLLKRHAATHTAPIGFTRDAVYQLWQHDWPLNVRELEQCLVVSSALATDAPIDSDQLACTMRTAVSASLRVDSNTQTDRRQLRAELVALMTEHTGNISAVARAMGKERVQIHRWLKRFQITPESFRINKTSTKTTGTSL